MAVRKLVKGLLYAAAGSAALLLLLLLAGKLALDRVPRYQQEIKAWVHARTGYHIAFAHVRPAFRWYGPELYFDQLELRSKDDQRVLARAAGARIGADVWQAFRSGGLIAGRIELLSPSVSVTRIAPDRFAWAAEAGDDPGTTPTRFDLDALPAGVLVIRDGSVAVLGWNAALPRLELHGVALRLRHDRTLALESEARLPASLGGVVSLTGTGTGSGTGRSDGAPNTLDWTAHVRTTGLSFAGWHTLLPEHLGRLGSGGGGFDVTAQGRGPALSHANLDFHAENVVTQLTDEPAVEFDQVGGVLSVTHAGDRWTVSGRRLRALRAGHRDPDSEFEASWRGDAGLLELQAHASYLRAETLLPLAGLLPQRELRERLQEIAPTGEWMDTQVTLARHGAADPLKFDLRARFRDVGFAPVDRAPGLRGLSGSLVGNETGGRLDLESRQGVFAWPAEFSQPIGLVKFKTTLYWKRTPDELLVATPSVDAATDDATLHGRFAWRRPSNGDSPVITLAAGVEDGNVAKSRRYLPRLLIAPSAFAWLDRAFVAGHLSHADVVLQGPVRRYPFRDGSGTFLARARMDGLTLDYKEGWPPAENLSVLAEFRNEGMSAQLYSGRIGNLALDSGDARFADFKTGELQLHTTASGDAADALGYLRATPLDALAEHAFSGVEARGPMTADVDLFLPFRQFDQRRTLVTAHLHGVALNRVGSTVTATELTGDADVAGAQVSRADVHGKLLGGAFDMQARTPHNRPATRTLLAFNGTVSGDALHAALALPPGIALGGTTDWHGVLRMAPAPARERSLRVNGSLAGLQLDLPEPLAKPAGRALPSSVDVDWPASGGPQIRFALGSVLHGQASFDAGANGPTLGRVAVAFGGAGSEPPPFSDTQIFNVGGSLDRLDLGGWLKLYTPDPDAKPLDNLLRTARFEAGRIDYLGLSFLDVTVDLTLAAAGWHVGLGGPNVVGTIAATPAASGEPWSLDFQRLKFVDGSGVAAPGVVPPKAPGAEAQRGKRKRAGTARS